MVQVEVDVVACVHGGIGAGAKATWELFQGELLTDQRGKRHESQVLCMSTLICINGALKWVMGFWTLRVKIWKLEIFCYKANSIDVLMAR